MTNGGGAIQIGAWVVNRQLAQMSCEQQSTNLRPLVMDLLLYLAERQGEVASSDELMDNLWLGKVVSEGTVYNTLAELRNALALAGDRERYIQTIPKKGYLVKPAGDSEFPTSRVVIVENWLQDIEWRMGRD